MNQRPTRVRWWVIFFVTAIAALLYLDRFCISFAQVYIQQDLGISDKQMGFMFGAFFASYALAQVPSGWLTDRFGARRMFGVYVIGWSLFTALMGAASGFATLLMLRLGLGVAQAGAFPTSAAILSRWVPLSTRGRVSSLVTTGGRAGAALAPVATALLIVAYVPTRSSSRFQPSDVLNPADIHAVLEEAAISPSEGEENLPAWMLANMSPELQAWASESTDKQPQQRTEQEMRDRIARDLNTLLADPQLPQHAGANRLALPSEGSQLLKRDLDSLSEAELQRLNRLLIEVSFPRALRRVYTAGWRPVMWTFGLLGLPLALAFWWVYRESPAEHPWANGAERQLVAEGKPPQQTNVSRQRLKVPIVRLMTNRSMLLNSVMQFTTNVGWVFVVTWLPAYLERVHNVPVEQRAVMTAVPVIVGFVGMLLGGHFTDVAHRTWGARWGRAIPIGASRLVPMIAYLFCLLDPSPIMAVVCFSLVAFGTDFGVGATWAYCQDVGGRHVGAVLGWGNMWGNLGAAVAPYLMVMVAGEQHNWAAGFLLCATAFGISALAGFGIDARDVIDRDEPQDKTPARGNEVMDDPVVEQRSR